MKLCVTEPDFLNEKNFCPKNEENGPKIGFFGLIAKFGHFFPSIWSVMKVCTIFYVPAQSHILENLVPEGPKCSWPIRLQGF